MKIIEGVKVQSFIPGRVRLKITHLKGQGELARRAESRLLQVPGIKHVEANPVSASLLVKYDRGTIAEPESLQALSDALQELFPDVDLSPLQKWLA